MKFADLIIVERIFIENKSDEGTSPNNKKLLR